MTEYVTLALLGIFNNSIIIKPDMQLSSMVCYSIFIKIFKYEEEMIMSEKICQSCGMPLSEEKYYGKNLDGSVCQEYCCYCYLNGQFSKDETMEEMIESCIPFMIKDGECKDEETARAKMMEFMPNLKRWNKN